MKKIYVIKGKEIEATTLEEARSILNKQTGDKTFNQLKAEAFGLALQVFDEILEIAEEQEAEIVKSNSNSYKIEDVIIGKAKVKYAGKDTIKITYIKDCYNCLREYEIYIDKDWSNTQKRTYLSIDRQFTIIEATTKQEYKDFIDNFKEIKEKLINDFKEKYLSKDLIESYKEQELKTMKYYKTELIEKYTKRLQKAQENLEYLNNIE